MSYEATEYLFLGSAFVFGLFVGFFSALMTILRLYISNYLFGDTAKSFSASVGTIIVGLTICANIFFWALLIWAAIGSIVTVYVLLPNWVRVPAAMEHVLALIYIFELPVFLFSTMPLLFGLICGRQGALLAFERAQAHGEKGPS